MATKEAIAKELSAQAHTFAFAGVAHRDRRAVVARYENGRYAVLWEIVHGMRKRPAPGRAERLARHRLPEFQQALKDMRFDLRVIGGRPYLFFRSPGVQTAYPVTVKGAGA